MAADDRASVELEAHSLKAASASLGATRLAELCAALEALARGGALDSAAHLGPLQVEFEQVALALESESLAAQ
jgi:HPt (histidine-containing phosphotransfer) domain-containing protein